MKLERGFVFYEGESLIDNKPIVGIVTGLDYPSTNQKTGQVLQSFILRADAKPIEAIKSGEDYSICGSCPLRRGICYVNPLPLEGISNSYHAGMYKPVNDHHIELIKRRSKVLRLGSYGDPAAIPLSAWRSLVSASSAQVGYTHQWASCDPAWRDLIMASVESRELKQLANSKGWRTFRVMSPDDHLDNDEMLCVNTRDAEIKCEICKLCNGGRGKNIVDVVHGLDWKIKNFSKLQVL